MFMTQTFRTTDDAEGTPRAFTLVHHGAAQPVCIIHAVRPCAVQSGDTAAPVEEAVALPDNTAIVPAVTLNPAAWKAMRDAQPSWPVAVWNALVEASRKVTE